MSPIAHVAVFGSILGVVLATYHLRREHYAREYLDIVQQATDRRARQIEAGWRARDFTNATPDLVVTEFLTRIKWGSLRLSEDQQLRLRSRLSEVLSYFSNPSFDEYYRLKTEGLHYVLSPQPPVTTLFTNENSVNTMDSRDASKKVWDYVHNRSGKLTLPRITAISLSSVTCATSTTNSPLSLLTGEAKQGLTVALEAVYPGFNYSRDPLHQPYLNSGIFFELSFLAKVNDLPVAAPVHMSLYWAERDKKWALHRLILDEALGVSTVF